MITAFALSVVGLAGFIVSMCLVVYLFWRRPQKETPLAPGNYHVKVAGVNKQTGSIVYDLTLLKTDEPDKAVPDFKTK